MSEKIDPARNAAADIVAFAKKRPLWQQDALRRLTVKNQLSDDDLKQLFEAVKIDCGVLPAVRSPALSPLTEAHLTNAAGGKEQVSLNSLAGIQNANQLKPGETLSFGPAGVTLVYGGTGSGKSGYTRIFKSATVARGVEDILADVFDPDYENKAPASATFNVLINRGGQLESVSIAWKEGDDPSDVLRQIRVFDRKGAALYVEEKTEIGFIPFNLDLLDRLGSGCIKLKLMLDSELSQYDIKRGALLDGLPIGPARVTGETIVETRKLSDIQTLCKWDEADAARLTEVQALIDDANTTLKGIKTKKGRLEALVEKLRTIQKALSEVHCGEIEKLDKKRRELKSAAEALRSQTFKDPKLLPGVGGVAWKALWDAARRYSTQVGYPDLPFPVTILEDDKVAQCLLCHQDLGAEAKARLESFEKFVASDIAQQAAEADASVERVAVTLKGLSLTPSTEDELTISEIETEDAVRGRSIRTFYDGYVKRNETLLAAIETGNFNKLTACPVSCMPGVDEKVKQLDEKIEEAQVAMTPVRKAELEKERTSLASRQLHNQHKASLESLIKNRADRAKLDACTSSLNTKAISTAKSDLNEKYITKQFERALDQELEDLGSTRNVTLQVGAQKAQSFVKPKFTGTTFSDLERVLSEGEHRAVALACFLTETGMMGTKHAVVIDDPVSSLDHERRHLVAKRLVKEAKVRQVIIFTHDMVFWSEVVEAAEDQGVSVMNKDIIRDGKFCGIVGEGAEPWQNLSVNQRLDYLQKKIQQELQPLFDARSADYADRARMIAVKLRDTWERVVEESVFRKVLLRYRKSIQTTRLLEVSVEDEDAFTVEKGMTRVSNWCHDRSRSQGSASPTPKELRDEIDQIRAFCVSLDKRKNQVVKDREARKKSGGNGTATVVKV